MAGQRFTGACLCGEVRIATCEPGICRRQPWLPPLPPARRFERDRDTTGRAEP